MKVWKIRKAGSELFWTGGKEPLFDEVGKNYKTPANARRAKAELHAQLGARQKVEIVECNLSVNVVQVLSR